VQYRVSGTPMTDWHAGLYVVATPIGNLGRLTPPRRGRSAGHRRGRRDTTDPGRLCARPGATRDVSLTEHNGRSQPQLLPLDATGSGARERRGTPAIADPGGRLVAAAHREGIPVFAVAGPSALAAALSVSGFDGPDAHFLGFLPRPKGERTELLKKASTTASILVFFESPNRLGKTLGELAELHGDPQVVVCRELTKLHEEVVRGRASVLAGRFATTRGECVVVVEVPPRDREVESMAGLLGAMKRAGARRAAAAAEVAKLTGCRRDEAYDAWDAV